MDTIKSKSQISNLFLQGRRINTPQITLIVLPQQDRASESGGRVAFIAGKKLGNAVWRNGAKRRMREVCRLSGGPWNGFDVIFLARRHVLKEDFQKEISQVKEASGKFFFKE